MPDQPVTSFQLTLPQGPNSALAAPVDLCASSRTITQRKKLPLRRHGRTRTIVKKVFKSMSAHLQMPTVFTAQNGAVIHRNTPIVVTGCARGKGHRTHARAHGRAGGK